MHRSGGFKNLKKFQIKFAKFCPLWYNFLRLLYLEETMDLIKQLCDEFSLKTFQVENTGKLIDEGNTIPFIARYRKEATGSLDDQVLRELFDRLTYLRNMEETREKI